MPSTYAYSWYVKSFISKAGPFYFTGWFDIIVNSTNSTIGIKLKGLDPYNPSTYNPSFIMLIIFINK